MAPSFIDFEAFQEHDGKYIIKELCIVDCSQPLRPLYYMFHAPFAWDRLTEATKKTNEYITRNLHGIAWEDGNCRFCPNCIYYDICVTFPSDYENGIFYMIGDEQKVNHLKSLFPKLKLVAYNITFTELPHIPHNIHCLYKSHGEHCSVLKCYKLLQHYTSFE